MQIGFSATLRFVSLSVIIILLTQNHYCRCSSRTWVNLVTCINVTGGQGLGQVLSSHWLSFKESQTRAHPDLQRSRITLFGAKRQLRFEGDVLSVLTAGHKNESPQGSVYCSVLPFIGLKRRRN